MMSQMTGCRCEVFHYKNNLKNRGAIAWNGK